MKKLTFEFMLNNGFNQMAAETTWAFSMLSIIAIIGVIIHQISNKVLLKYLHKIFKKTKNNWDDTLMAHKTFHPLAYILPLLFLTITLPVALFDFPKLAPFMQNLAQVGLVFSFSTVAGRFITSVHDILKDFTIFQGQSIKSYFQIVNMGVYILTGIFVLSILMNENPMYFISAFGAFTAVLMFVFKDAILGLVASIQLSVNNMLKVGDWISMPKYDADGDVMEMNLTTVKVQNWDKTITTIPTNALIENSFKNWKGMQETGGRRICRSLNFRASSIKLVDSNLLKNLGEVDILKNYISNKLVEIEKYNKTAGGNSILNKRALTNIGLFREYSLNFIKSNKNISQDLTCMVRQMPSSELGVPIQIYCFTDTVVWSAYEGIQGDLFDHLIAAATMFELEIFEFDNSTTQNKMKSKNLL